MRKGPLWIATEVANALHHAACRALPHELVGALGGQEIGGTLHIRRFLELPSTGCSRDRFTVAPEAFAAAEAALRAAGCRWLGFVHSHPAGGASPSATDARELWRDCVQIIVGLGSERPRFGAFWIDAGGVHELPLRGAEAVA